MRIKTKAIKGRWKQLVESNILNTNRESILLEQQKNISYIFHISTKSEDQIRLIQNVKIIFDSREKIIDFFRDYSFLLSEAKHKAKYEKRTQSIKP